MSLTYLTYVQRVLDGMGQLKTDLNVSIEIPAIIDYAEQRCYRDLDILNTVVRDSSAALTVGTRTFDLPTSIGRFVVTNGFNVITPLAAGSADAGTRNQLIPTTRDFLDAVWGSTTGATVPQYYAMITDQQIIVGPAPDQAYMVEVIGTTRPNPLSASNSTTYLSLYLPDLFVAASMIYGSGLVDASKASGWEQQYQSLLMSANVEEQRKRYAAQAWTSMQPAPLATPPRQ